MRCRDFLLSVFLGYEMSGFSVVGIIKFLGYEISGFRLSRDYGVRDLGWDNVLSGFRVSGSRVGEGFTDDNYNIDGMIAKIPK
ncbi:hypothetical protein RCL_jg8255.t1 [Rhizophagus clarus]|uniref:Uncharacterized protein n=1 Tax=Rhizophagus clarus TaxID=94130 RepID=A0A8H3MHR5_9GLOM|nr:hypothetical protein RCL_jg8255.t1 [Rhizophagus clarus]